MFQKAAPLLPTTVVGSYPQPEWLIDRAGLKAQRVPRIRAPELWRVSHDWLMEAQNDATVVAIRDMERAGIDIVTDGEIRRESYSSFFGTAVEGIDIDNPWPLINRNGSETLVPRIVAKIRRTRAVECENASFLRTHTERTTKMTIPGPFTLSQQAKDEFYGDPEALAMDFAAAINEEAHDLEQAGIDVIQIDEPWVRNDPDAAKAYAVKAINRALDGLRTTTVIHVCFGYARDGRPKPSSYEFLPQLADSKADQISIEAAQPKLDLGILRDLSSKAILLGVIDLGDPNVESAETVAARIRKGLEHIAPERLIPAPDCGMKYLNRTTAFGKLKALSDGAAIVRRDLQ